MPNSLADIETRLRSRLSLLGAAHQRFVVHSRPTWRRIDISAWQEGAVSSLWQSWGQFCRTVLLTSATGATTKSGAPVTSGFSHLPEGQLLYVAKQFAMQQPAVAGRSLVGSHQEPTWADPARLTHMITGMAPTNASQLLTIPTALFLGDLQVCRNACAHVTADRVADVNAARVKYTLNAFRHPSDMMHWVDPSSNQTLWSRWLLEMQTLAALAVG